MYMHSQNQMSCRLHTTAQPAHVQRSPHGRTAHIVAGSQWNQQSRSADSWGTRPSTEDPSELDDDWGSPLSPANIESSPRWRWPGFQTPTPPPPAPPRPPSPPESFIDSPFDFWSKKRSSRQRSSSSSRSSRAGTPPPPTAAGSSSSFDLGLGFRKPKLQNMAQRLFRNREIQELAKSDISSRAADEDTATATRGSAQRRRPDVGYAMPPDVENITDAREFKREFSRWIEYKSQKRMEQRSMQQDDEIWGLTRVYFVVALVVIVVALASGV